MNFEVGQKIVAIEDGAWFAQNFCGLVCPRKRKGPGVCPAKGRVYTVAALRACICFGYLGVEEIDGGEVNWFVDGFRPIVDAEIEKLAEIAANPPPLAKPAYREPITVDERGVFWPSGRHAPDGEAGWRAAR